MVQKKKAQKKAQKKPESAMELAQTADLGRGLCNYWGSSHWSQYAAH